MFAELIKTETCTVRGREFVFHEISALDWVEYLVTDDEGDSDGSPKVQAQRNRDFSVRVIATSLAPGVEQSVDELIAEMAPLSNDLIGELFAAADSVNGLTEQLGAIEGKGLPDADTPAA